MPGSNQEWQEYMNGNNKSTNFTYNSTYRVSSNNEINIPIQFEKGHTKMMIPPSTKKNTERMLPIHHGGLLYPKPNTHHRKHTHRNKSIYHKRSVSRKKTIRLIKVHSK